MRQDLVEICDLVSRNGADIGRRQEWFDRLDAEVLKKVPRRTLRPLVTGLFLTKFAWDARGDGPGSAVGADAGRAFKERLEGAETELTRAWELDKRSSRAAAAMVNVCTGLGRDRETMEQWFRRALEADPDEPTAFIPKMRYLHPNWHGTKEDVLAFGRQAARSENWEGKVPILLPKAHYEIAAFTSDFQGYFRDQPEVWKEIEPVLEGLRKRYPKSRFGASWYLYYAWVSEKNPAQAWAYVQAAGGDAMDNPFTRRVEVDAALEVGQGRGRPQEVSGRAEAGCDTRGRVAGLADRTGRLPARRGQRSAAPVFDLVSGPGHVSAVPEPPGAVPWQAGHPAPRSRVAHWYIGLLVLTTLAAPLGCHRAPSRCSLPGARSPGPIPSRQASSRTWKEGTREGPQAGHAPGDTGPGAGRPMSPKAARAESSG